jgi:hypothetical protein
MLSIAVSCDAATAHAGEIVTVATPTWAGDVAVGGGRVVWATQEFNNDISVFSAGLATRPIRLLYRSGVGLYDPLVRIWASNQRVAVEISDQREEVLERAWGRAGARSLRPLRSLRAIGTERIQELSGGELLTLADRTVDGVSTIRAYVRTRTDPRSVGPRIALAAGELPAFVEARMSARWVAIFRPNGGRTITVYDRKTHRRAWTVVLPEHARGAAWDLGENGTLAVSLARYSARGRLIAELGWARRSGSYHKVTSAVVPGNPFMLRGGLLTYARPIDNHDPLRAFKLYVRERGGNAKPLTGAIPGAMPAASDGKLVAAVVKRNRNMVCVLAAQLPVSPTQRWKCPRTPSQLAPS